MRRRIADYGIQIGRLPKGPLNKISDVDGVMVGHATIDTAEHKTGVTIIYPCTGNVYLEKPAAAVHVLNGHGKSMGLVQIEELGVIESPIALTNTLNIGLVADALTQHTIEACDRDGKELSTFNPVVGECNDSGLNNIRKRAVGAEHVREAFSRLTKDFEEGDVGAGKGMSCHGLKGGIGSASRLMEIDGTEYTLGALVLSNHGKLRDLCINGYPLGEKIVEKIQSEDAPDIGSIITVLGTDLPLSPRQLKRLCKRTGVGLARVGSFIGHGSGENIFAFSTANRYLELADESFQEMRILRESKMDLPFRAVAECVEEAVLNSMMAAATVKGYRETKVTLEEYINLLPGIGAAR